MAPIGKYDRGTWRARNAGRGPAADLTRRVPATLTLLGKLKLLKPSRFAASPAQGRAARSASPSRGRPAWPLISPGSGGSAGYAEAPPRFQKRFRLPLVYSPPRRPVGAAPQECLSRGVLPGCDSRGKGWYNAEESGLNRVIGRTYIPVRGFTPAAARPRSAGTSVGGSPAPPWQEPRKGWCKPPKMPTLWKCFYPSRDAGERNLGNELNIYAGVSHHQSPFSVQSPTCCSRARIARFSRSARLHLLSRQVPAAKSLKIQG